MTAAVDRALASAARVSALVEAPAATVDAGTFEAALDALRRDAMSVAREQNAIARALARDVPDKAKSLQRALILQAALFVPVSAGLAAVLFLVIARPLRQISRGIRALGRGALGEPIVIEGARDLEELGQRLEWLR
jgi:two-component system sensor histidine kinase GlrK